MLAQAALRGSRPAWCAAMRRGCPLPTRAWDWVFSSLALQWSERPAQAFAELNRVLKTRWPGLLRPCFRGHCGNWEAWRAVDGRDHVDRFLTLPQLQQAARDGGFEAPALCPRPGPSPTRRSADCCATSRG